MLLKRLRTKRCQKSTTTSRSRCRQRKEIDKGVPLSNYGKNVGRLDWAGGGNGYEEVNGGISMATIERRHLERRRFSLSVVQVNRSLISWKPAVNFNLNFLYLYI